MGLLDPPPPKQPADTAVSHAAFLLVWQTVLALNETDPRLGERILQRMKNLATTPLGQDNDRSMQLVMTLLEDLERHNG
jgi:hypothetical protein